MKPIYRLSLKDKIKILHSLFPEEIPKYISYLKNCAVETIDDSEEIARGWGNNVIQHGYWTFLADRTFTGTALTIAGSCLPSVCLKTGFAFLPCIP